MGVLNECQMSPVINTFWPWLALGPIWRVAQSLRQLREQASDPGNPATRMIFAATPAEAERLLSEKREPRPLGEE